MTSNHHRNTAYAAGDEKRSSKFVKPDDGQEISSADDVLSDDFWASTEYCGYLHCTYQPGTLTTSSLFMNETYARLVGLDRSEMTRR